MGRTKNRSTRPSNGRRASSRSPQNQLFEQSFAASLNCPLTPATRGLVGRAELDRLGPDGYLINTSRGGVVQEDELVAAIEDDRIAGAALDVCKTEHLPADNPLTSMEKVILGSHNAGPTDDAVARTTKRAFENLVERLKWQWPDW